MAGALGLKGAGRCPRGPTHQLSVLGAHRFGILQQCLELVVLGESDDFQNCAKLREDLPEKEQSTSAQGLDGRRGTRTPPPHLMKHIQGDWVEEVLHDDPEHWTLASHRHPSIHSSPEAASARFPA